MRIKKSKVLTTIALILTLTISVFMAGTATVKAADVPTYAFISVQPNPAGVNEAVYVILFMDNPPPTASGPQGDRWEGYKVTITKPDGTTEEKGPFTSNDDSTYGFPYTPTMIGTYKFVFNFPGQHIVGEVSGFGPPTPIDNNYLPSTSRILELEVKADPPAKIPDVPFPSYWTRPIYGENRELASLGGNWLMPAYNGMARAFDWGSAYAPNNKAPDSAHILWMKPITFGGMVGNEMPGVSYYTGLSYEQMFKPPVIINGYLYYNLYKSTYGYSPFNRPGYVCVDLSTGQELWRNMEAWIDFGQIYDYESPNQHGAHAYLWMVNGTTWKMMDAFTGTEILEIANAPSPGGMFGSFAKAGPYGEVYVYELDPATGTLKMWNSYKAIGPYMETGSEAWQWRPYDKAGEPLDGTKGYEWTVTDASLIGKSIAQIGPGDVIYAGGGGGFLAPFGNNAWTAIDANTGSILYSTTISRDASIPGSATGPIGDDIYTEYTRQTLQWTAYDIKSGQKLWTSEPYKDDWALYGSYMGMMAANGKLYHAGYDGYIHAFDLKTGQSAWDYYSGNAGLETPYGTYPFYGGFVYADGKIFGHTSEHSPSTPLWKGEKLHVMNADTGAGIWKISGWFQHPAIADGKLVSLNGYDNQIYCFGKGPSATTVTVTPKVTAQGTTVLIEGMVTDQSPAQKDTPAVSDGDQSAWMEYLHMQKAKPQVTGVPVKLTARDSNGNTVNIATVTSDLSGFKYAWQPPSNGLYTITATFEGSASYGESSGSTGLSVSSTAPTAGPSQMPLDVLIIVATIVIVIVMILATIILLRKK